MCPGLCPSVALELCGNLMLRAMFAQLLTPSALEGMLSNSSGQLALNVILALESRSFKEDLRRRAYSTDLVPVRQSST